MLQRFGSNHSTNSCGTRISLHFRIQVNSLTYKVTYWLVQLAYVGDNSPPLPPFFFLCNVSRKSSRPSLHSAIFFFTDISLVQYFLENKWKTKHSKPLRVRSCLNEVTISLGSLFNRSNIPFFFCFLDASASVAATHQGGSSSGTTVNQNSPGKYSELLAVIEELGKDIRPTYAGSKNAAERLKKGKTFTIIYKAYLVSLHANYGFEAILEYPAISLIANVLLPHSRSRIIIKVKRVQSQCSMHMIFFCFDKHLFKYDIFKRFIKD